MLKEEFNEVINKYNIKENNNYYIFNDLVISYKDNHAVIKGKIPLNLAIKLYNDNITSNYNIKISGFSNADPCDHATDDIFEEETDKYSKECYYISQFVEKQKKAIDDFRSRNNDNKYIKKYEVFDKDGFNILLNEINTYKSNNNRNDIINDKVKNVTNFYVLCNKLKHIIRTGWKIWNVSSERLESVAEHIFGTQMVAIAMKSEFDIDVDLEKVILMLAVHELEEIFIGDIPMTSKEHANKKEIGHQAVKKVLSGLLKKDEIESIILEFDERKTKEAKFAYMCDKIECDLQEKVYDESGYIDLYNQPNNEEYNSFITQRMILDRARTVTEIWFATDEHLYNDNKLFKKVFEYTRDNKITGNN